jgi:hypothetical protein
MGPLWHTHPVCTMRTHCSAPLTQPPLPPPVPRNLDSQPRCVAVRPRCRHLPAQVHWLTLVCCARFVLICFSLGNEANTFAASVSIKHCTINMRPCDLVPMHCYTRQLPTVQPSIITYFHTYVESFCTLQVGLRCCTRQHQAGPAHALSVHRWSAKLPQRTNATNAVAACESAVFYCASTGGPCLASTSCTPAPDQRQQDLSGLKLGHIAREHATALCLQLTVPVAVPACV